jgi:hypothetical protein
VEKYRHERIADHGKTRTGSRPFIGWWFASRFSGCPRSGGKPGAPRSLQARAGASLRGESDRYKQRVALPIDKQKSRVVLLGRIQRVVEVLNALHGSTVHLLNYIAGAEPGFRRMA